MAHHPPLTLEGERRNITHTPAHGCAMSSKKGRRRKLREQERDRPRGKLNPAIAFMLSIALAVLLMVVGVVVFGDRDGPGQPPWPGAVWSPAHDHWH